MKTANMSKMKWALCLVAVMLIGLVITGCSSSETPAATATPAPESAATEAAAGTVQSYTFEAEYVDLTDKAGAGPSNAAFETELVLKDSAASNGYYIGYTYFTDLSFDFVITSDAAKEATLKAVLGSDLGIVTLTPAEFEISLNGTAINYDPIKLADSSGKMNKVFKKYTIGKVDLVEGENILTLRILANELYNGTTGGPLIDCLILDTEAQLSWSPVESNVN